MGDISDIFSSYLQAGWPTTELKVRNPAGTFVFDFQGSAITQNKSLILPNITGTSDTVAVIGTAQTYSGGNTFSAKQDFTNVEAIRLSNGSAITGVDSGATARNLMGCTAANAVNIGASAGWTQLGFFVGGEVMRLTSAGVTISPVWTVSQSFNNNLSIFMKDSGGNLRIAAKMYSSDVLQIGDSAGLTGLNLWSGGAGAALTFSNTNVATFSKRAEAGIAETLAQWSVSDASGNITFMNASTVDGDFVPWLRMRNTNVVTTDGNVVDFQVTTDSGSNPVVRFLARTSTSTDITTRPLFSFRNNGTEIFRLDIDGVGISPVQKVAQIFNNNIPQQWKDLGGTARSALQWTSGNNLDVGHTTTALVQLRLFSGSASAACFIDNNNFVTWQTVARTGVAETLAEFRVTDASSSHFDILNGTALDNEFYTWLRARNVGANATLNALLVDGQILAANDTGTAEIVRFAARTSLSADITTRPLFTFKNNATTVLTIDAKGSANHVAIAQAGLAELCADFKVSDNGTAYFRIVNGASADAIFVPRVVSYNYNAGASNLGMAFTHYILAAEDTGTVVPIVAYDVRRSSEAAITTRPLFEWRNFGVKTFALLANGDLDNASARIINAYAIQQTPVVRFTSFVVPPTSTFVGTGVYAAASTVTGTPSTSNDAGGGYTRVSPAASVDAVAQVTSPFPVSLRTSSPKYQLLIQFDSILDTRIKIGFSTTTTFTLGQTAGNTCISTANAGACFRYIAGVDTTVQFVTQDANGTTAENVTDTGFTPVSATQYVFEIYVNNVAGNVTWTIYNASGVVQQTGTTTTQIPTTAQNLYTVIKSENQTTTVRAWVFRWQMLHKNGTNQAPMGY